MCDLTSYMEYGRGADPAARAGGAGGSLDVGMTWGHTPGASLLVYLLAGVRSVTR